MVSHKTLDSANRNHLPKPRLQTVAQDTVEILSEATLFLRYPEMVQVSGLGVQLSYDIYRILFAAPSCIIVVNGGPLGSNQASMAKSPFFGYRR